MNNQRFRFLFTKKNSIFFQLVILLLAILLLKSPLFHKDQPPKILEWNVHDLGAMGDGDHDDTSAVQKALNQAKNADSQIKVVVPAGTYKLTDTLHIYKNTHLILEEGAIFLRSHNRSILINGDWGETYSGYYGHGNIIIEGGIWDGNIEQYPDGFNAIGIARGKDITIRNIEVRDVANGHAIDLNASKNVLIENNHFLGYIDTTKDGSRSFSEAVQISEHTKNGFGAFGPYDGTPSQNIVVRNNFFGGSQTKGTTSWPVGIGNHLSIFNKYNEEIKITNNRFYGMTHSGIHLYKWKNTLIQDNLFEDCRQGITFMNPKSSKTADGEKMKKPQSGSDVTISGNTFKNIKREAIFASGWKKARIEEIVINDNMFYPAPKEKNPVIALSWVEGVDIQANTFLYKKKRKKKEIIQTKKSIDVDLMDNIFKQDEKAGTIHSP
jgi:polygalacturonase